MAKSFARLSAQAALVGGLLRVAGSFTPALIHSNLGRQSLYFTIDACLTIGLAGFWWQGSKDLGRRGVIGLAMFLTGIATVRASVFISAVDLYPAGALITAGGAIVVSARAWVAHKMWGWVPLAFLVSTLFGVVGSVIPSAGVLFVWSGVIFGLAFAGVGRQMWIVSNS